jgi:hypothetical protein
MARQAKQERLARDQALIPGINAHLANAPLIIQGKTMTGPALVTILLDRIGTGTKVVSTKAAWVAAAQADDANELATDATVRGAIEAIYIAFGNAPDVLADFGLPVRKKGSMTPAERLAASVKAKATRAARHTMGPKQKAAITGVVPAPAAAMAPVAAPVGSTGPIKQ